MPETPFNIADSVSDLESHRSPARAIYSLDSHYTASFRSAYLAGPVPGPPPAIGLPWAMAAESTPTSTVTPLTARKTWRTVEPFHGMVYFAP